MRCNCVAVILHLCYVSIASFFFSLLLRTSHSMTSTLSLGRFHCSRSSVCEFHSQAPRCWFSLFISQALGKENMTSILNSIYFSAILILVYLFIIIFVLVDVLYTTKNYYNLVSLSGIVIYVLLFFIFSVSPAHVSVKWSSISASNNFAKHGMTWHGIAMSSCACFYVDILRWGQRDCK